MRNLRKGRAQLEKLDFLFSRVFTAYDVKFVKLCKPKVTFLKLAVIPIKLRKQEVKFLKLCFFCQVCQVAGNRNLTYVKLRFDVDECLNPDASRMERSRS